MATLYVPPERDRRLSRSSERGQSLVEFAIFVPIFLLIVFMVIDFGRVVYAYHVVANCAREGARSAQVWPHPSDAAIVAKALNKVVGLAPADITVTVKHPPDTPEDTIRVDVSYTFRLITPIVANLVGGGTLLLHGTSTMYTGW